MQISNKELDYSQQARAAFAAAMLIAISACSSGSSTPADENNTGNGPGNTVATAPVANDDAGTSIIGGSVTINVLENDTDANDNIDASTVTVTVVPVEGTTVVNANGSVTYTHTGTGTTDTFSYTVSDQGGLVSTAAMVTVTVTEEAVLAVTSGLVAHYEADSGIVTRADGSVLIWEDQSNQGNDLDVDGDPMLISAGINGQAILDLDGTQDSFRKLEPVGLPVDSDDRSIFMMANYRSGAFGGVTYGVGAANAAFGLINDSQGRIAVQGYGSVNDFSIGADVRNTWLIQSAVLNGNTLTHYRDGALLDTQTHEFATGEDVLSVGKELADLQPSMDMQIAAVLIYDRALSTTEQIDVQTYLQTKYYGSVIAQSPLAVADEASVEAGMSVVVNVVENDIDINNDVEASTVNIVSNGSEGVATSNGDGTVTYLHTGTGTTDTFQYTVRDTSGLTSNPIAVTITVSGS